MFDLAVVTMDTGVHAVMLVVTKSSVAYSKKVVDDP